LDEKMKIGYIVLSLLIAGKLCANCVGADNSVQKEIQKNRDLILSENLSVDEGLHPMVEEFRKRIFKSNEPLDFHEGQRILADTEFLEWYLVRPLFAHYVQNPTKENLSEFEHLCKRWKCRSQLGILIKLATYNKLKETIDNGSIGAFDTSWAARDLASAAQTEYSYYLEALASPELMEIIVTEDKLSKHEIETIKRSESYENRLHYKRIIESAKDRDITKMMQIHEEAMQIKTTDNNKDLVFKMMWPNWPMLLNKIQPVGAINSEAPASPR
jgi:effector-binding domain-containing protein